MILDRIVEKKQEEVGELKKTGIKEPAGSIPSTRGFIKALTSTEDVAIIAEVKKASPSKGVICPDFNPVTIASDYQKGGAEAVSVLTDESFFHGPYIPTLLNIAQNYL